MYDWAEYLWSLWRDISPHALAVVAVWVLALVMTGCAFSVGDLCDEVNEDAELRQERIYAFGERAAGVYYPDKVATTDVVCGLTEENGWHERKFELSGWKGYAVLLTNQEQKRQLIVVRGTDNLENWVVDAKYAKDYDPKAECHLHRGFKNAAFETWEAIKPYLYRGEGWTLGGAGHSLGGAVITILGMYGVAEGHDVTAIVTFGAPKVTNKAGAEKWDHLLDVTRIVHSSDGIPLLPMTKPSDLFDDGRFWHFGMEILVDDDGGYETFTSAGAMRSGHTSYWYQALTFQRVPFIGSRNHPMASYLKAIWYWVPRTARKVKRQSDRHRRRQTLLHSRSKPE